MVVKTVIAFLIKVFPLFFVILLGWQRLGLAEGYHHLVAGLMTRLYPLFDATELVHHIGAAGGSFVIELAGRGVSLGSYDIVAGDITSNMALLLALYLASPILPHPRKYLLFAGISLASLFVIHCFTLGMTIFYAFATNPQIVRRFELGGSAASFADTYVYFYEIMGMYLFILILWLPYILFSIMEVRRRSAPDLQPPPKPDSTS